MGLTLKNSLKNKTIAFGLIGIGFAFVSTGVLAQNARIGMVFTSSAKECAMACTADMTCAAWVYSPVKIGTTGASTGQCNFSNSANINAPQGSQSGLPLRRTNETNNVNIANAPSSKPTSNNNLYQGNYSVKPLNNNVQIANSNIVLNQQNNTPPVQTPPRNNASVSFAPPVQSTSQQYVAQTQFQPLPQIQVPAQQAVQQAQPIKMAANSPTSLAPKAVASVPTAEANTQKRTMGPLRSGQTQNMQQFVGADGMVDAAEMRRAQLRNSSQNGSGYSVQKEWNEVAQSMANGTNNPSYDYSNTTPIPLPKEENDKNSDNQGQEKSTQSNDKKGFFGLFGKSQEQKSGTNANGPLRRHSSEG